MYFIYWAPNTLGNIIYINTHIDLINTSHLWASLSISFDLWSTEVRFGDFSYLFMGIFTAIDQERCENRKHLENWNVWHFLTGFLFSPSRKTTASEKKKEGSNKNHSLYSPPAFPNTTPLYEKNFRNIYSFILECSKT